MLQKPQSKTWIVYIAAIISTAGVICVALIVFGAPFANRLADRYFTPHKTHGLVVDFEGSVDGADGQRGYENGLTFVAGHTGQGVLLDNENTLYYLTDDNIHPHQGAIEFWLKPLWNGEDNQNYVFFEIGDSWFNRLRITKDGANNFRFILWNSESEYGVACNVSNWVANDWHQARATWQSDSISLYLDGVLCDTQTSVEMPNSLSSRFYIGSSASRDMQAQSVMDEFVIYSQP